MKFSLALSAELPHRKNLQLFENIGLIRGEYICRKIESYITTRLWDREISDYLNKIITLANGKEVWYRFSELEIFEINVLAGCDHELDTELNPTIGLRGVRRSIKYIEAFEHEVSTISKISAQYDNFGVIIPFVSSPEEIEFVLNILKKFNYNKKIAIMIETPSAYLQINDFCLFPIDKFIIGMNDFTSLILAKERVGAREDYLNPIVLTCIKNIVKTARSHNILISVAGYFPKEILPFFSEIEIDEVIVHYSMIDDYEFNLNYPEKTQSLSEIKNRTRELIAQRATRILPYSISRNRGWHHFFDLKDSNLDLLNKIAYGFNFFDDHPLLNSTEQLDDYSKFSLLFDYINEASNYYSEEISASYEISNKVDSMCDFWDLVSKTNFGKTDLTFWDTFENGRRVRLEREIAAQFHSESSILVNSGMSAISVVFNYLLSKNINKLGLPSTLYFETHHLIQSYFSNSLELYYYEPDDSSSFLNMMYSYKPDAVFFESVTNLPNCNANISILDYIPSFHETIFIIDNSVKNLTIPSFSPNFNNLIVVESGTKFLCEKLISGVIYGTFDTISSIKIIARDNGQLLQGRALAYLSEPFIRSVNERVAIAIQNSQIFSDIVMDASSCSNFKFSGGKSLNNSPIIYITHNDNNSFILNKLLLLWKERSANSMNTVIPTIRAGFGYFKTTARVYESSLLNKEDAPIYLRISVGIEPTSSIINTSQILLKCIRSL